MLTKRKINFTDIPLDANVKVVLAGDNLFVEYNSRNTLQSDLQNTKNTFAIKKIDKDTYVNEKTGKIHSYNHVDDRSGSPQSVKRSINYGKQMIYTNISDSSLICCLGLTLTYKENIQVISQLRNDFKNFFRRFQKHFKGIWNYIAIIEYQNRKAIHLHGIMFRDEPIYYIDYQEIKKCWNKGSVHVRNIQSVEQIINYFIKDKIDLPLSKARKLLGDQIDRYNWYKFIENGIEKIYVEGAGAIHYPPFAHIFTYSKGCKRPVKQIMKYSDVLQILNTLQCVKHNTIRVSDEETGFSVCYMYEHYKNTIIDNVGLAPSLYSNRKCDESEYR